MASISLYKPWICAQSYASDADAYAASVMAVLAHTGVTITIVLNACKDTFPWCCFVVFFPSSMLLLSDKLSFLLSQAFSVNHIFSIEGSLNIISFLISYSSKNNSSFNLSFHQESINWLLHIFFIHLSLECFFGCYQPPCQISSKFNLF